MNYDNLIPIIIIFVGFLTFILALLGKDELGTISLTIGVSLIFLILTLLILKDINKMGKENKK